MNTNTQHIPFIRKLMKDEPEQNITNAEERFIAFASLVHRIGARLLEDDDVP